VVKEFLIVFCLFMVYFMMPKSISFQLEVTYSTAWKHSSN
jgi:hypothetical protein